MDKQHFMDLLTETENLTDELQDSDARWLMNWGIYQLEDILHGVEEDETASRRVNALMSVMRKINTMAGSYTHQSLPERVEDFADLYDRYVQAFVPTGSQIADFQSAAEHIENLSVRQVLEFLTGEFLPFRTSI
jgi:hypothetical protein